MYYRNKSGILLLDKKENLYYYSQQDTFLKKKITAFEAYSKMTADIPLWLRIAFTIRDNISCLAGVKKIHGFSGEYLKKTLSHGDYIDFFKILRIKDDEMCLLSEDVHLSVLISLNIFPDCNNEPSCKITVTASVIIHNFFGKMYMIPVSLTHDIIVKNMLSKVNSP
ncbi:DUF2867 domain-containing protein [Xenorhabdus sp. SGI240]|uniref:DUF2867 domain-containing protein n=1 Tax=Xenorhabdus sp. SGI240 TaxID=3158262 RepID=UPI0032B85621